MTTATAICTVKLPSREPVPVLGQGTWGMAEDARRVSNFDLSDMAELAGVPGGTGVETDNATPPQIALARVLLHDGVTTIPKASTPAHVRDNRVAYDIQLTRSDPALLESAFPPPSGPQPLEVL